MDTTSEPQTRPETQFDWLLYADATFAALSLLIPVPFLDTLFESFFRRRMVKTIARRNGRSPENNAALPRAVQREIHRSRTPWYRGCLSAPLVYPIRLLKRLSRKLLYVFTIKEATDSLNASWHRAFLLDYMVRRGDLDAMETAVPALKAMDITIKSQAQSPMTQLAGQVLHSARRGARHVLRTILRWLRRGQEDDVVQQTRATMAARWPDFADYFAGVATQYEQILARDDAQ